MPTPNTPCRPGERLIRGKVYVFDVDVLKQHLAREAVLGAGDLDVLSFEALTALAYDAHAIPVRRPRAQADELQVHRWSAELSARADRIITVWTGRPEYRAAYGARPVFARAEAA